MSVYENFEWDDWIYSNPQLERIPGPGRSRVYVYIMRRQRNEFKKLESRFVPGFREMAQSRFVCEVLGNQAVGEPLPFSFQEQCKLERMILNGHGRRDRFNARRRARKIEMRLSDFRPEYITYLATGMIKVADPFTGQVNPDVAGALVDGRLWKKLIDRCEMIHESLNPLVPPHRVDRERARAEARVMNPQPAENRGEFEQLLRPTAFPAIPGGVVPFAVPELVGKGKEGHEEEATTPGKAEAAS